MNAQISLSVLMPSYNAESYIDQAIESILAQSYSDFEFLILDDGSTDGTMDSVRFYQRNDSRIRVRSRENRGLVESLNELVEWAEGGCIARMDADDVALPHRFALQAEYLSSHPEVLCVGGAYEIIDIKSRKITEIQPPTDNQSVQNALLAGHSAICHSSAMIRKSALQEVGGYLPDTYPAEDFDLWLRLGELGHLENLEHVILKYRVHEESISGRNNELQVSTMLDSCRRAADRRGLNLDLTANACWRPSKDVDSQFGFILDYGWRAWNSYEFRTAAIYAFNALRLRPLSREAWILLFRAVFHHNS